jgi:ferredoxin-NADP reductase
MNVTLDHIEEIGAGIRTFWFRPESRVRYVAGQFTELWLPHDDVDDRGPRRWFTLSSSPTEELVSITTKFADARSSSFKQHLAAMRPGTSLHLADPMGDFVLPKDARVPLVFVAGGLGITPMRSMIKYLIDSGEQRQLHLIYTVRHAEDLAFKQLFEAYGATVTPVITAEPGGAGSLTSERILQLAQPSDDALIYLSGPEPMTETFFKQLPALGIREERLVTDYFPGYAKF